MQITVEIKAPDLSKAIYALANALENKSLPTATAVVKAEREEQVPEKVEAPKQEEKKAELVEDPLPDQVEKSDKPAISLEVVRSKLAGLSQAGKQKEVKSLIQSFGVRKLTDIPEEKYPELLEKLEELA